MFSTIPEKVWFTIAHGLWWFFIMWGGSKVIWSIGHVAARFHEDICKRNAYRGRSNR